MTFRALTLQDVISQISGAANAPQAYDPTEIINGLTSDNEGLNLAAASEVYTVTTKTDYPLNLIQDAGPSGYWRLDDPVSSTTVFDSNPFASTTIPKTPLNVTGGVTFQSGGAMAGSKSALFDGTSGYLSATSSSQFQFVGNLTIEAWVLSGSLATTPQCFLTKGGIGSQLLAQNDAEFITSVAGWTAQTNCSIALSSAQSYTASNSMAMTATAGGQMAAFVNSHVTVTPGTTYAAWFYCYTPNAGRQAIVQCDVFNSSDVYQASYVSGAVNLVQNQWTWVMFTFTPATGQVKSNIICKPTATGAGEVFYVDSCRLGTYPSGEFGALINNDGSMDFGQNGGSAGSNIVDANTSDIETSAAGWTAGTNTTIAQSTTHAHTGTHALAMTATTAGAVKALSATKYTVTASTNYLCTAYFYSTGTGRTAYFDVDWYDGTNTLISSSASSVYSLTQNGWTQVNFVANAPGSAATAQLNMNASGLSTSEIVWLDTVSMSALGGFTWVRVLPSNSLTVGAWHHVAIVRDSQAMTIKGYLDGNLVATNSYTGAVTSSTNTMRIAASATPDRFFNGRLDEFAIYQRALSDSQIAARYAWGTASDVGSTAYGTGTYGGIWYPTPGQATDYNYGSAYTWGGTNAFYWG